ncbi:MAG: NAD-dependent epimerase/dehydratase family protein, partial [Gammaproteobacteria bacterium]
QGVDRVIHTAALVKIWAPERELFRRVNVEAFQQLLWLAAGAGVERVVYTSSFFALGPSSDPETREHGRRDLRISTAYVTSKREALEWLHTEGFLRFPVVALLPGVVYGPGPRTDGNLVGGMIDQYLSGRFPGLLGSGEQRWSFAFMPDVVQAHLAALELGKPGEEYLLAGDNRSLNEFFRLLTEITGLDRPVRHIPAWAGKLGGAVELALAETLHRIPRLTPGVAGLLKEDWVYSSRKAVQELGYHLTELAVGLRKTLEARGQAVHRG